MAHQDECPAINDHTALLIEHGPAAMASALATLMNHAMQIEREQVLQAESHQRTADRQGYANGFKPKTPKTRDYRDENGRPFYPRALERGVRSERAMTLAVAEMYVQGVSTRKVTAIVEELCGLEITSTQVSRAAAETHWRSFLQSLVDQGLRGVKLVVSDDHGGLKAARQAVLAGVPWQRCQFHLMQNAMAHVPKIGMRAEVASDLRRVFDADEPAEAERRLRTTNGLERLKKEIKRRTRVATLFPNEASLLRLASAVLSEISDDWETERAYLTMEAR